ncbi:MAG TPA: DUF4266 domain-containing protein [Steroidobacteraceae bacterium]|nr:DUF4266 domain-containing protein [Steroidobacteraceae bacterium]
MNRLGMLVLLGCVALTSACGQIQPWVKPYERERLADRVMAWDRDAIATSYITHVRENREGARGGTGEAGGGCGCN